LDFGVIGFIKFNGKEEMQLISQITKSTQEELHATVQNFSGMLALKLK